MLYSKKYKDIEIVINTRGAEQESLIYKGFDYMRKRDDFWNRKAPVLFPIVGKLRDLKTYIDSNVYMMNQHGFARDKEFTLFNEDENSIEFVSKYDEETLKMYPYKFNLFIKYEIKDMEVNVYYNVKNVDDNPIFFNIGAHPGFKLPLNEGNETFEDYSIIFEEEENFDAPSVESNGTLNFDITTPFRNIKKIDLNYKYFVIDAIVLPHLKSRYVDLVNKDNKGIRFSFYGLNSFAIWTRPNAPFVCLEPWQGYADKYNSDYNFKNKDDIVKLDKNDEYKAGYSIHILN
ncbi:MAG: aldose 1-epimerase family protein [Bacilli bacterium]|nr:aldose 1-epimerase family protein [Bacilli bacterium]